MDFEIAIIAVGLTRQQTFEFAPRGFGPQFFECGFGFGDNPSLALGVTQLDQFQGFRDLTFDALVA
jgi:hypothetical protein